MTKLQKAISLLLCAVILISGVGAVGAVDDGDRTQSASLEAPAGPMDDVPGDSGDSGDSSDTGDSGDSGDTGDAGDSGDSGDSGDTGDAGDSGDSGDTGDAGDSGDSGDAGDSGDSGDAGDSGETEPIELIQLTPPEVVGWGRDYRFLLELYRTQKPDEIKTDAAGAEYVECPGMIYWSIDGENQGHYRIDLYRRDDGNNVLLETAENWDSSGKSGFDSNFRFFWSSRISGVYYFTIQTIGDGVRYESSETKQSEDWTYEAPEHQLTQPSRPRWKNVAEANTAFIYPPLESGDNAETDSLYRIGYQARWWYSSVLKTPTDDGESEEEIVVDAGDSGDSSDTGESSDAGDGGDSSDTGESSDAGDGGDSSDTGDSGDSQTPTAPTKKPDPSIPKEIGMVLTFYPRHFEFRPTEKMLGEYGSGYYSVQIRALSGDIAQAAPSEWSELSMVRHIEAENLDLEEIVGRVDKNTDAFNRQLAINNVRRFGTERLREMMSADVDGTGAASYLAALEDELGQEANVVVSGGLDEIFPEETVSVIGAGLNVDLGQSVIFHLGQAQHEEVPSTLYDHALRFSMQLLDTNGASLTEGGTDLAVPIRITLPVPDTLNPRFLVILHHRTDGVIEKIPTISVRKIKGQWEASFLVTSFSDFTFAEEAVELEARRMADGVSVSCRLRDAAPVKTAFCAILDASGQTCAVAALEPSETRKSAVIPCDGASAARVKLFLLNDQNAPLRPAAEVPVS